MSTRNSRNRWIAVSAFCAPLVLVELVSLMSGGPNHVAASSEPAPAAATLISVQAERTNQQTPAESAAMSHAVALRDVPMVPSPFLYNAPPDATITIEPSQPVTPGLAPPPRIIVQAIMGGDEPAVVIQGTLYHVGSFLYNTWQITAIDARTRTATLYEQASDRTITAGVE